jgi:hypothetical protein
MFSLPRTTATTGHSTSDAEGTSDANPICLPGVTELEFETLLRYFYKRSGRQLFPPQISTRSRFVARAGMNGSNSMHDGFSLPQSSWIALLSIAHHYEFLNVRERAIREIYDPAAQQPQDHDAAHLRRGEVRRAAEAPHPVTRRVRHAVAAAE